MFQFARAEKVPDRSIVVFNTGMLWWYMGIRAIWCFHEIVSSFFADFVTKLRDRFENVHLVVYIVLNCCLSSVRMCDWRP